MMKRFKDETGGALVLTLFVVTVALLFAMVLLTLMTTETKRVDALTDKIASEVLTDMAVDHFKLTTDRILLDEYNGVPRDLNKVDPSVFADDISVQVDDVQRFMISRVSAVHEDSGRTLKIYFTIKAEVGNQSTTREHHLVFSNQASD